MVKQRFSSADVAAEAACLRQRCLGMRVANVYDINPKTYVLKLARSGEDSDKVLLLVESGVRFHTVEAMPEKADTPSNFTLKLRKHIRTRRLEAVKQLGVDRIVQLTFGSGAAAHHLLLEFYAQGNVILADDKFEVLTLLRSHRDDAKGVAIMARHPYPIHTIRLRQPLGAAALEAALAGATAGATLKTCLADLLPYGPLIAEHCILSSGLEPSRLPASAPLSGDEQAQLLAGVREWEAWLDACEDSGTPPQGYVLTKPPSQQQQKQKEKGGQQAASAQQNGEGGEGKPADATPAAAPAAEVAAVYEEFEPLLIKQHQHKPAITFPTFDAAVAEFFGKIQGQRSAVQQAAKEKAAVGKLEAIRRDHEKRLGSLGKEAEAAELKAALIEYNLEAVDAALNAVREAVASGMDWRDLARMIKEERRAGNPVAGLIDSLQLERSRVTLLLSNWLDEEEGDEEAATRPATKVEVDLELSAHANARAYYDSRRKHKVKTQKTLDANQKALKAAEKKAQQQLKQVRSSTVPVITRKPFWFEKFHWFISSENYLVLSGRDAQQNELLVKRYMRKGDVYVHADLHGASTTIIKNQQPDAPIPPLTLSQAGQACVCRSQAWDAKVVTSAWWVHPEQVSKAAPTGEYLVTGSFMIRGRKNYLPPQPLVMGFGYMFGLAEESIPAHVGERAPRLREGEEARTAAEAAAGGEAGASSEDDVDDDDDEEAEEADAGEEASGSAAAAAAPSALEAFMDASFDTLAAAGPSAAVRRGSSTAGGGAGSGAAADAVTAAFERYGLTDTLEAAGSANGLCGDHSGRHSALLRCRRPVCISGTMQTASIVQVQRLPNRPASQRRSRQLRVSAYISSQEAGASPPPTIQAANQLESLRHMSKVVADTGEIGAIKQYQPVDCTTNPSLLLKAMQDPEYVRFLDDAVYQERRRGNPQGSRPHAFIADQLAVNIGTELLSIVPGRVSTEVDAHLSYDTMATVDKALHLVDLYVARGIDPKRLYIKIASTWEGIRACEVLQQEGIDCNMTLLFSFAQAAGCADAGAALISPFVGRIMDWHKKKEGREFAPEEDPGVLSVKRIYSYYKRYNYSTTIMAASFRNVGEIRELAGCDNITIAPPLLKELEACRDPLPYKLWPRMGDCEDEHVRMEFHARELFDKLHGEDQMAVDKLKEGIDNFSADQLKLEELIGTVLAKKM